MDEENIKIIFMGTGEFALPALEVMAPSISLVVSQPDRPSGRGLKLTPSLIKKRALELGLKVETPEKCRDPLFVEKLKSESADFLLVASYGQILSEAVLQSTKQGGINLHGSILPKYRGATPVQRVLLNGEVETGVTLMQMDKGMDTGDIIEIQKTFIHPDETYGELQVRLAHIAANLCRKWASFLVKGEYPRISQESALATLAPKIQKEERELSFWRSAKEEYNRFRALSPKPGVFIMTSIGLLKLINLKFSLLTGPAGTILQTSPELIIGFEKGSLVFKEVHPAGKKLIKGMDLANGYHLKQGDSLSG